MAGPVGSGQNTANGVEKRGMSDSVGGGRPRRRTGGAAVLCVVAVVLAVGLSRQQLEDSLPEGTPRFSVGDHVFVSRHDYDHHGIVRATNGLVTEVAHVISPAVETADSENNNCTFAVTSVDRFLAGSPYSAIQRMRYGMRWSDSILDVHTSPWLSDAPSVVMARVSWLLKHSEQGLSQFMLLGQESEHAAHWCRTGQQWSRQHMNLQEDGSPFSAREDPVLANEIDSLQRASSLRLPQHGDILALTLHGGRSAVAPQKGGVSEPLSFEEEAWPSFRVHRANVEIAGDRRLHLMLGFELLAEGCFIGHEGSRIVCRSSSFGRGEWFVAHESGVLQHFQSGGFISKQEGSHEALIQNEEILAAELQWPLYVRARVWRPPILHCALQSLAIYLVVLVGSWICPELHLVEPLLHVAHLLLVLCACTTLWLCAETRAFVALFSCCLVGLPYGQARAAVSWQLPLLTLALCCFAAGSVLRHAYLQEQPLLSAAAHALLVCIIILASADIVMASDAYRCRPGWRPPSMVLASLTVPVLMVSSMLSPALGYTVPPTSATLRMLAWSLGVGRLCVGRSRPPQSSYCVGGVAEPTLVAVAAATSA